MQKLCPACNGLTRISVPCQHCSHLMSDQGRLEDYAQPYSPYDRDDQLGMNIDEEKNCQHLLHCPDCKAERTVVVPLKEF
ncbi:hypothetical protein [Heliorestis convoluta]|uniref:Uncharacterized protein n=1 Tax=Heliorestis convoluta TaxID=356322 RepID=A0A5Q2N6S1_9FIRM|nr:hypothetical protein [Heliorestis convoluta]QGG49326.1 hypothetical protein FTV88_3260 [Heliorestis convoluta]